MTIHCHKFLVEEDFFAIQFQLPPEGISSFVEVSALDVEEIQIKFSTSCKLIKVSDSKREMKF